MKTKLHFGLSVIRLHGEDRIGVSWRAWSHTPDARMGFFSEATTFAQSMTKVAMKRFRTREHMARMRAIKAAKREA